LTVPAAHGLFHKAIVDSGVGWWAMFDRHKWAVCLNQAGCRVQATVEQLRRSSDARHGLAASASTGAWCPKVLRGHCRRSCC
jgi:carboxylesterase type B